MFNPNPWYTQKSDFPGGLLIKPIPGQVIAQCDEGPNMERNAKLLALAPKMLRLLRLYNRNNKSKHNASLILQHETEKIVNLFK